MLTMPKPKQKPKDELPAEVLHFFRRQGLKGGRKLKRERGPNYYKRIGKLGGRPPTKKKKQR